MLFRVYYTSRYSSLEGTHKKLVRANSRKEVRDNCHSTIDMDEYRITKIEEVAEK